MYWELQSKQEQELVSRQFLNYCDLFQGLLADLVLKLKLQVFSPRDYVCRFADYYKKGFVKEAIMERKQNPCFFRLPQILNK